MNKVSYSIYFPNVEQLQAVIDKLNAYKALRAKVSEEVIGHVAAEEDWILFDEMLTMDYKRMIALLKVLEERAG